MSMTSLKSTPCFPRHWPLGAAGPEAADSLASIMVRLWTWIPYCISETLPPMWRWLFQLLIVVYRTAPVTSRWCCRHRRRTTVAPCFTVCLVTGSTAMCSHSCPPARLTDSGLRWNATRVLVRPVSVYPIYWTYGGPQMTTFLQTSSHHTDTTSTFYNHTTTTGWPQNGTIFVRLNFIKY